MLNYYHITDIVERVYGVFIAVSEQNIMEMEFSVTESGIFQKGSITPAHKNIEIYEKLPYRTRRRIKRLVKKAIERVGATIL